MLFFYSPAGILRFFYSHFLFLAFSTSNSVHNDAIRVSDPIFLVLRIHRADVINPRGEDRDKQLIGA